MFENKIKKKVFIIFEWKFKLIIEFGNLILMLKKIENELNKSNIIYFDFE